MPFPQQRSTSIAHAFSFVNTFFKKSLKIFKFFSKPQKSLFLIFKQCKNQGFKANFSVLKLIFLLHFPVFFAFPGIFLEKLFAFFFNFFVFCLLTNVKKAIKSKRFWVNSRFYFPHSKLGCGIFPKFKHNSFFKLACFFA